MKIMRLVLLLAFLLVYVTSCNNQKPREDSQKSDSDLEKLAEEAYIYGLPIIMSYKTMYYYSVDQNSPQFKAPFNQLKNTARVYGPKDVAVVSANSDTPYSLLWTDLRAEPVVLSTPNIDDSRYFVAQSQDLSTYLMPYIGTRTTGNGSGNYLITGPDWSEDIPEGIDEVIPSESQFAFTVIRTQLFGPDDLNNVTDVQKGYRVQPLSSFLGTESPAEAPAIDFPAWDEKKATGRDFISYLNFSLQFIVLDEREMEYVRKLAPVGVGVNKAFNFEDLNPDQQKAIDSGVQSAIDKINKKVSEIALAGHTKKDYDYDWLLRAAVTQMGWGANDPKEASYPIINTDESGNQLDASQHNYSITFEADRFPPVKAFWSLTMYDNESKLMIENVLDRYLLNSPMMDDFVMGSDGSLTLYFQKDSPGKELEANWLPAPNGEFYMLLRLYGPEDSFFDGSWEVPKIRSLNK